MSERPGADEATTGADGAGERLRARRRPLARPFGLAGRIVGTLAGCALALAIPPGSLLRTHIVDQVEEIGDVLRLRPDHQELMDALLGPDHRFVSFVADHTDEDAIILMSDQFAVSELDPLQGKSQRWVTFFLYPRRVLYMHQEEVPWYRDAEWLVLDGPEAVEWIEPSLRPEYTPGELRLAAFPLASYLDRVASGEIDARWLPPREPSRTPKSER